MINAGSSERTVVIRAGWLTTLSRFARKMGAALAIILAVASVPWATPSAPSRAASLTIQGNSAPLGVVAAKQGGGQLVGENRDHDVRPTPKKATASGGESSVVDPPASYAPIAHVTIIAAIARDRRALHFLPEQTGPPVD